MNEPAENLFGTAQEAENLDELIDQVLEEVDAEENLPKEESEAPQEENEDIDIDGLVEEEDSSEEVDDEKAEDEDAESDSDSEDEEQVEEDSDTVYEIKVNGETVQVSLEELQNGYSRQADYSRKTDSLAKDRAQLNDERKQIETQIQAERAQLVQAMNQALTLVETNDPILHDGMNMDWAELARDDPEEYTVRKAEFDQRLETVQTMNNERNQLMQQQQHEVYVNEAELLKQKSPDWADPVKSKKLVNDLTDYLTSDAIGYARDDVDSIMNNHLNVIIAEKARAWDNQQASTKSLAKKKVVKKATKVIKSKGSNANVANQSARTAAAEKKLNQDRYNTDNQVDYIMSIIDEGN